MIKGKIKIGVIGLGMVGGQIKRWFEFNNYSVFEYDRYKNIGSLNGVYGASVIFLCLPTPHRKKNKEGTELLIFEDTIRSFKDSKIFIVKSTVPPGTTDKLQNKFKKHYFLHNPEFLSELTAWEDFSKPELQLIGYTAKSKKFVNSILKILPKAKFSLTVAAKSTESFKLARNAFFAVKVIFANEIYDLCKALGIDYEEMRKMMSSERWIGSNHLIVNHKGYRGFGGKCLPKDLKTFIKAYKNLGINSDLFDIVDKINMKLIERQGLTKTFNMSWLENHN